ncbi:large-conductance mechanosensitive channel protein MscL [Mycolicibacterium confluentis]|uniref:Large-conductance mechanosensitive channel n=1 Tax=Mycolicibacterium confluentis TaxID=28047 RepID=A0A7I7XRT5_9MYCO|nr:large-conductance mechanosensitive channel protein MscL [Mycolicibacterium confluentis]MCV7318790.1 large-conductance mechanosensitive channel protein MscL [Mycolicibacterium confluentis]ORV23092.1 mechanosensitive ion channel protein MscL [Mycolicibacterium confluentis]BBZ31941.1 large-conductance mechanosensitive channel [Mycolicibacterium confluentis]
MLKGFKEFIARGNVIDLAVAVVIGAAFTAVVTSFTTNVIEPLISRIGAGPESDYGILRIPLGGDQYIDLNAVLTSVINFLLVAAVVYFLIVVPFKKLKERDTKVEEDETELTVLTEIRDLLRQQSNGSTAGRHGAAADPIPPTRH